MKPCNEMRWRIDLMARTIGQPEEMARVSHLTDIELMSKEPVLQCAPLIPAFPPPADAEQDRLAREIACLRARVSDLETLAELITKAIT